MATVPPTRNHTAPSPPDINPAQLAAIARLLHDHAGFPLASYKENCIARRINIRMRATGSGTAQEYCDLLRTDSRERSRLLQTLTIHVSHFFRNPSTYELLRTHILPEIFSLHRDAAEEIGIWSAGCSGGEEPYSLAILLREYFYPETVRFPVRLFASDINSEIMNQARQGSYLPERLAEVSPTLKERYFVPDNGRYRISASIRDMVQFRAEDLLATTIRDCDLIVCRNVMIYFERSCQEALLHLFAELLRPGGFLVLGKSETVVGAARKRFQSVSPEERIYRLSGSHG